MSLVDEIDAAVVEVEIDLELRVRDEKIGDCPRQVKQSERHVASSDLIRLLTTDLASPRRCAAPEKLAASTARTNTVISSRRLTEFRFCEQSFVKI
jgi:hypothetical protein